jgi:Ca2+-binding RTX toxin-like protein
MTPFREGNFNMTSFVITGSSTTPQTLTTDESGYVGPNGDLFTAGFANAVTLGGTYSSLAILGAVTSVYGNGITGPATASKLVVGATGQLSSLESRAISVNMSGFLDLKNLGSITAGQDAIGFFASDENAELYIENAGTILASSYAIYADTGAGRFLFANSGTVMGGSTFSTASAIGILQCGSTRFENSGSISGSVQILTSAGFISTLVNSGEMTGNVLLGAGDEQFTNTGLLTGDIALGDGDDTVTNLGGRITGTVDGGNGSDTYHIDRDDLSIVDTGATGTDTVHSRVTHGISDGIENLVLTGSNDIRGFGSDLTNVITGNVGDNVIVGRGGADLLSGGDGNDTLRGGAGSDTLRADEGDDLMIGGNALGIDLFDCGIATPFTVNLATGTASSASTGDDTLSGIEDVLGGGGNDTITGGTGANSLFGQGGDDSISGGNGTDTLSGDLGTDTLTGGAGMDTFLWQGFAESPVAFADLVRDFQVGIDVIDLSVIDANGTAFGDGAFAFGGAAFLPVGQASVRVVQDAGTNRTYVDVRDTSGSGTDMRIQLVGLLTLTADDFVL